LANENDKRNTGEKTNKTFMFIYGLFLERASWTGALTDGDENSRTTIVKFPVKRVEGSVIEDNKPNSAKLYKCPMYKYPKRTDKYFIVELGLTMPPTGDQDERYWQKRGVAMLSNEE
jgi:dynein heavy chain, axonemal